MNVALDIPQETSVAVARAPEDLAGFLRPECAAMVWNRRPLASFQAWIDQVAPEHLPKARVILRADRVREAVLKICGLCETPDCIERSLLIDDTAALAQMFAEIMQVEYLLMRFEVVSTNKCRKFHTDAVTARLICTYRGTGTQLGVSRENTEPQLISTVPTGAPVLLRGTLWPEHPKTGLRHRSPPIEGSGETRLLLVLDPVSDPNQHESH